MICYAIFWVQVYIYIILMFTLCDDSLFYFAFGALNWTDLCFLPYHFTLQMINEYHVTRLYRVRKVHKLQDHLQAFAFLQTST